MADKTVIVKIEYDTDEAVKSVEELTSVIEGEKVAQAKLKAELESGKKSQKEYAVEVEQSKETQKKANQERQATIRLIGSEKGSINELKAYISKLEIEQKKINRTTEEGAKQYKANKQKIDELKRSVSGASTEHKGLAASMKSGITQAGLMFAGITGGLTILKKFWESIINASDALKDDFQVATNQAKAAFDTFKVSIATLDFSNFFSRMGEAIRLAEEYTRSMQAIEDSNRSLSVQQVKQEGNLARLKKVYQDVNKTTEERTDALNEYMKIVKDLGTTETKNTKAAYDLELKTAAQRTGLMEEQIRLFIEENDEIGNLTKSALELGESQIKVGTVTGAWSLLTKTLTGDLKNTTDANQKLIDTLIASGMEGEKAVKFAEGLKKLSPEKIDALTNSAKAYYAAQNKFDEQTVRQESTLNKLEKSQTKLIETQTKTTDQYVILTTQINAATEAALKKNQELFEKSQMDFDEFVDAQFDKQEAALAEALANEQSLKLESYNKEVADFEKKEADKRAAVDLTLNTLKSTSDTFFQWQNDRRNADLESLRFNYDQQIQAARARGEDTVKLEKQFAEKEKQLKQKQDKAAKRQAVFKIALDTAGAIVAAIRQFGPPPSPLGIAGIIAATVIGGAQTAAVLSAKPPQYAKGGIIGGKSHAQGGTRFVGSDGSRFEAERGEAMFVLKKDATAQIAALSAINESFGGRSFSSGASHLQNGGNVQPVDIEAQVDKAIKRTPIFVRVHDIALGLSSVEKVKGVGVI